MESWNSLDAEWLKDVFKIIMMIGDWIVYVNEFLCESACMLQTPKMFAHHEK